MSGPEVNIDGLDPNMPQLNELQYELSMCVKELWKNNKLIPSRELKKLYERTCLRRPCPVNILTRAMGYKISIDDISSQHGYGFMFKKETNSVMWLTFVRGCYPRDIKQLVPPINDKGNDKYVMEFQKSIWGSDGVILICKREQYSYNSTYNDNLFSPFRIDSIFDNSLKLVATFKNTIPEVILNMVSHFKVDIANILHISSVIGKKSGKYLFSSEHGLLNEICKSNKIKIIFIDLEEDNSKLINHFISSYNFRVFAYATKGLNKTWIVRVSSIFEVEEIDDAWMNNISGPIMSKLAVRHLVQDNINSNNSKKTKKRKTNNQLSSSQSKK